MRETGCQDARDRVPGCLGHHLRRGAAAAAACRAVAVAAGEVSKCRMDSGARHSRQIRGSFGAILFRDDPGTLEPWDPGTWAPTRVDTSEKNRLQGERKHTAGEDKKHEDDRQLLCRCLDFVGLPSSFAADV